MPQREGNLDGAGLLHYVQIQDDLQGANMPQEDRLGSVEVIQPWSRIKKGRLSGRLISGSQACQLREDDRMLQKIRGYPEIS